MSYRLEGAEGLQRLLEQLPAKTMKKVERKALDKAAKPIIKAAKSNLKSQGSVRTRRLLKSIGKRKLTKRRRAAYTLIAVIGGRVSGDYKGHHAHLVERGHRLVVHGQDVGEVKGKPFLEPAFESNQNTALKILESEVEYSLQQAAMELANTK